MGLGFRVQGLGFRVCGSELTLNPKPSGFVVQSSWLRVDHVVRQ